MTFYSNFLQLYEFTWITSLTLVLYFIYFPQFQCFTWNALLYSSDLNYSFHSKYFIWITSSRGWACHSSAPTCLSFLCQCFLQKGFSHHKTYFYKSNFAPLHQTLAISWSCYLLRWYFRKGHYSVSPLASSFIRNIHM